MQQRLVPQCTQYFSLRACHFDSHSTLLTGMQDLADTLRSCNALAGKLVQLNCSFQLDHMPMSNIQFLTRLTSLSLGVGSSYGAARRAMFVENDSLMQLASLPLLSHLCLVYAGNIGKHVTRLLSLQALTLLGFGGSECGLNYCTQLTSIELGAFDNSHLWLPDGQAVALQHLKLENQPEPYTVLELHNLGCATHLTYLALRGCYPVNNFLPVRMPLLQELELTHLQAALPALLLSCKKLSRLDLSYMYHPAVPEWFSSLTQLTSLTLLGAGLELFPDSVFHLTHLRQLDISQFDPPLEIPQQISDLAFFPQLTFMKFSTAGISGKLGIKSYRNLLVLSAALGSRHSDLKVDHWS